MPEIKKEDLCFFHDNSGYRYRLEYHPQSCMGGSGAFSVCPETSGKIKMFENLQAAVPKVRTFKNPGNPYGVQELKSEIAY